MAKVIELNQRQDQQRRRQRAQARRRAQAVASALACGLCPRRCAHCGLAIEEPVTLPSEAPYPFCGPCLEEYQAFRRRQQGQEQPEAFWHNDAWARSWSTWLEFMRSKEEFRQSAAFLRLMQEHID